MKTTHKVLNNGFKVIFTRDDSYPLINIQLYVKMGSCWENNDEAGFSHLMEHLVFKSTEKYPQNTVMERASTLGGSINAFTEYDSTCFYLTLPKEKVHFGLDILAQLVRFANFSDEEFYSEKKVVIEELKQYRNDKEDYFIEQIPGMYFKKSPFIKPIIGSMESLQRCKPDELRRFYQKYYQPLNCFICISGDFNTSAMQNRIKHYFADWINNHSDSFLHEHLNQYHQFYSPGFKVKGIDELNHQIYHHFQQNFKSNLLAFVLPEFSDKNKDSYALSLLCKMFAMGKNSILYQRLFIKEKLVDTIKVHSISGIYNGLCLILVHPRKYDQIYKIIQIFIEELKALPENVKNLENIEYHRNELIYAYLYSFEFMESLGLSIGSEELLGNYQEFFLYLKKMKAVSSNDLIKLARDVYSLNYLMIATSGKTALKIDVLTDLLNQFKMTDLYDSNFSEWTFNVHKEIKHLKSSDLPDFIKKTQRHSCNITISDLNSQKSLLFKEHVLANGIRLFMKKVPQKAMCGVSLALKSAQIYENHHQLGLNQLTSTLLMYGNSNMSYEEFLNYCTKKGVQFSISCAKENTKIKFKCFNDHLYDSLALITDVLYQPVFPKEHFKNLQKTFISTIKRMRDYPQTMAVYNWKQLMFGEHSNLLSKDGQVETLSNFSTDDCMNWHEKHLINCNANLVIAGDIDFDNVITICEKLFNKGQHENINHALINHIDPAEDSFRIIQNKHDQSIINIGGFSCKSDEVENKTALFILSQILGGEINSRLFNELREKRGIAYSVDFDFDSLENTGYFNAFSIVDKNYEQEAINAVHTILESIARKGVSKKEFNTARQYILGLSCLEEESILSQVQVLSTIFLAGKTYDYYLRRNERLMNVKMDKLQEIASMYFKPEKLYTLIYR
ncbi:MAG TPA: pitrilysin family protein [Candidatus Cloacimonadota bacterium]|nr:pitrilysin family protein [Candidatus Cloacimonadota bacterium]